MKEKIEKIGYELIRDNKSVIDEKLRQKDERDKAFARESLKKELEQIFPKTRTILDRLVALEKEILMVKTREDNLSENFGYPRDNTKTIQYYLKNGDECIKFNRLPKKQSKAKTINFEANSMVLFK